jgi:hypothetical protein
MKYERRRKKFATEAGRGIAGIFPVLSKALLFLRGEKSGSFALFYDNTRCGGKSGLAPEPD